MVDLGSLPDRTFVAVLFDMDGTLVDSTPAVERSWQTWATEYDLPRDALQQAHGIPAATTARNLLPPELVDEAIERITAIELADTDGVIALPGSIEALTVLDDSQRAIVTSCPDDLFELRMRIAEIPMPSVCVTVERVQRGKPAPDPYLLAAELLGVDPRDCLVVEDAVGGLESARAAGCATLALTTTTPRELLEADGHAATLADVAFSLERDGIRISPA
ncbi:HAD-IA family hydrolase [Aestuariimicrobium ganziense]|uniref:HAD-IA family hydrolase n=1 Tax=Aestuariimicrobium ganziense TaxID=2773677 RepID=UPI002E2DDA43|nr:HAD-IA family hydrolase [Aestuariimicrobium ganziense]